MGSIPIVGSERSEETKWEQDRSPQMKVAIFPLSAHESSAHDIIWIMEFGKPQKPETEQAQQRVEPYSKLQLFFLLRLWKMYSGSTNPEMISGFTKEECNLKIRLLKKAVYSTYVDCIELGVGKDARTLFQKTYHKTPQD